MFEFEPRDVVLFEALILAEVAINLVTERLGSSDGLTFLVKRPQAMARGLFLSLWVCSNLQPKGRGLVRSKNRQAASRPQDPL